jgi:hypothetical protein
MEQFLENYDSLPPKINAIPKVNHEKPEEFNI